MRIGEDRRHTNPIKDTPSKNKVFCKWWWMRCWNQENNTMSNPTPTIALAMFIMKIFWGWCADCGLRTKGTWIKEHLHELPRLAKHQENLIRRAPESANYGVPVFFFLRKSAVSWDNVRLPNPLNSTLGRKPADISKNMQNYANTVYFLPSCFSHEGGPEMHLANIWPSIMDWKELKMRCSMTSQAAVSASFGDQEDKCTPFKTLGLRNWSPRIAIQGANERDPNPRTRKYSKNTKRTPNGPPPKLPGKNSNNTTKSASKIHVFEIFDFFREFFGEGHFGVPFSNFRVISGPGDLVLSHWHPESQP